MESETKQLTNQERMMELMSKRDHERKIIVAKNAKAKKEKSKLEGLEYFETVFETKIVEIENSLNTLEPSTDITALTESFNSIGRDLQELQRYFTSSTIFLNDFKIKTSQNTINRLNTKADETKSRLIPKKKFGFKNKVAKVEPVKKIEDLNGAVKETNRKEFEWTESKKSHKKILLTSEMANNQDLTLSELNDCIIVIQGHPGSLQISKIKNCVLVCGPVARSIFADNCVGCTFAFSCQQLRLHTSSDCNIYLHVTSRGIIEDTTDIRITPYNYNYDNYDNDLKESKLDASVNNWRNIGDFNWLSTVEASPNWSAMKDCDRVEEWQKYLVNFQQQNSII